MIYRLSRRRGPILGLVVLAAAVLMAATAAPVQAGFLGKLFGVGGAGHGVHKTMEESTSLLGKSLDASMEENAEKVSRLSGEIKKIPGNLIRHSFPVLDGAATVVERLGAAKRKIKRFVGGVSETVSDARAALATGKDRDSYEEAGILGKPLPAVRKATPPRLPKPCGDPGSLGQRRRRERLGRTRATGRDTGGGRPRSGSDTCPCCHGAEQVRLGSARGARRRPSGPGRRR